MAVVFMINEEVLMKPLFWIERLVVDPLPASLNLLCVRLDLTYIVLEPFLSPNIPAVNYLFVVAMLTAF